MSFIKTTGVVRRIDELGRIVIPKEIRRNLGIRDGENLEILVENQAIILKKHNYIHSFLEIGEKLCEYVLTLMNGNLLITDREKIVCTNSTYYKLKEKLIDKKYMNLIDNRESYVSESKEKIKIDGEELEGYISISPIIYSIDSLGLVILISENKQNILEVTKLIAKILSEKIDIC